MITICLSIIADIPIKLFLYANMGSGTLSGSLTRAVVSGGDFVFLAAGRGGSKGWMFIQQNRDVVRPNLRRIVGRVMARET